MKEINTAAQLKVAINELKTARAELWPVVKEQMLATAEFYRPHNIMKTALKKIFVGQEMKTVAFNTALGVTTGFIANSVLRGIAIGPLSKFVAGTLMGMVSNKKVLQHSPGIRSIGNTILKRIFNTN
jgi:hypothetical protein